MGADSVAYHRATVLGGPTTTRARRSPTTPAGARRRCVWGGAGAERLGLAGAVTDAEYEAIFGPGGARRPATGERLAATTRPGMELVVAAHKSVAELGVIGRAEDMHAIMDAERDATLAYLDELTREPGGRRGRAAVATPTAGLVYAHTRHATSRAGDPARTTTCWWPTWWRCSTTQGGWKAADTALWREHLHAATAVGRHGRPPGGRSSSATPSSPTTARRAGWATGPSPACPTRRIELHSKRAGRDRRRRGRAGLRLLPGPSSRRPDHPDGQAAHAGRRPDGPLAGRAGRRRLHARRPDRRSVEQAGRGATAAELGRVSRRPSSTQLVERAAGRRRAAGAAQGVHPPRRRRRRSPRRCSGATRPSWTGWSTAVLADPEAVPLVGVAGARERAYATASVLAVEPAIADIVAERHRPHRRPPSSPGDGRRPPSRPRRRRWAGRSRPARPSGRRASARRAGGSSWSLGVAGSGKTTALAAVRDAYEAAGYRVVGTATSGQAARTLGREAGIDESRTLASLLLAPRPRPPRPRPPARASILDEAGMTDDPDLLRLLDRRPDGPGQGGPGRRRPPARPRRPRRRPRGPRSNAAGDAVHVLDENVRQADPGERQRPRPAPRRRRRPRPSTGTPTTAASPPPPTRDEALDAMVDAWLADIVAGLDTGHVRLAAGQRRRAQPHGPGPPGPPTATSTAPSSKRPAAAATPPATGSSPSPPAPTARSSPARRGTVDAVDPDHGAPHRPHGRRPHATSSTGDELGRRPPRPRLRHHRPPRPRRHRRHRPPLRGRRRPRTRLRRR